jgi:hypothetical protein
MKRNCKRNSSQRAEKKRNYHRTEMPNAQLAVWHKRGSGSPESLCGFASFAPVRAAVEAPPAPSRNHVGRKRTKMCGGQRIMNLNVRIKNIMMG